MPFSNKKITKIVVVEPVHLENYRQKIYEKLSSDKSCDKKFGYTLSVDKKSIKILNNSISDNGNILFEVEYSADTMKPEKGDTFSGVVGVICFQGIIVHILDLLKVFIPADNKKICDMTFDEEKMRYKKGKKIIEQGSRVEIAIDKIKYENSKFSCIGKLV